MSYTNHGSELVDQFYEMINYPVFNNRFTVKGIEYTPKGYKAVLKMNFSKVVTKNTFNFRSANAIARNGHLFITSGYLRDIAFMLRLVQ